jgi:hypothetical protein
MAAFVIKLLETCPTTQAVCTLKAECQLQHRGAERPKHQRSKPRALCATAPNQLFSWDITYLPTCITGISFYLYLFLDIF